MIRYRLDDLGWFQFEWLIQALLKTDLGVGIESWGGTADFGRDAYFSGSLNYPANHITNSGTFLFQAKFVQDANSAGSKPDSLVLKSVHEELKRIDLRLKNKEWEDLDHYTLITNANLTAATKEKIKGDIANKLPKTKPHISCGNDICDLLDKHPQLRRSFPQLLSLRDLDSLISEVVNKETIERSLAAIDLARDIAPSFIPTGPYNRAWKVLQEHYFVVLEGPPEMGKTAIAWMISLAQLSQGWSAIICNEPSEFFRSYKKEDSQVFIADDAFGRTEYDPSRLKKWEIDLNRVMRTLNPTHWLIWTSRKHILERARNQMDLEGKACKFPEPGAVLVNASKLNLEEKSLILYRHARAQHLEMEAKDIVRRNALVVVQNVNFTPERIRRFVQETLPTLVHQSNKGTLDAKALSGEVLEAIRNPTERMRKAFNHLNVAHKWALITVLETGSYAPKDQIKRIYETLCPVDEQECFDNVYGELCESFLKPVTVTLFDGQRESTEWIHPSYKDLVIEELSKDKGLQLRFLKKMSHAGIKLAISDQGGAKGERKLPLMNFPESWDLLKERCVALTHTSEVGEIIEILTALQNSFNTFNDPSKRVCFAEIISLVCHKTKERWDAEGISLTVEQLEIYCEASSILEKLPSIPNIQVSWKRYENNFKFSINEAESKKYFEPIYLKQFLEFAGVIHENEPRFLRRIGFPSKYFGELVRLISLLEEELSVAPFLDSANDLREEAERLDLIIEGLTLVLNFKSMPEHFIDLILEIIEKLRDLSKNYSEKANEVDPGEPDYDDEGHGGGGNIFSVEGLFTDL